jgi:hypothetical protein
MLATNRNPTTSDPGLRCRICPIEVRSSRNTAPHAGSRQTGSGRGRLYSSDPGPRDRGQVLSRAAVPQCRSAAVPPCRRAAVPPCRGGYPVPQTADFERRLGLLTVTESPSAPIPRSSEAAGPSPNDSRRSPDLSKGRFEVPSTRAHRPRPGRGPARVREGSEARERRRGTEVRRCRARAGGPARPRHRPRRRPR